MRRAVLPLFFAVLLLGGCSTFRRTEKPTAQSPRNAARADTTRADRPAAARTGIKPYKDVIKDTFAKDEGVFTLHRDGQKLWFEIADSLLGREFLQVTRISKTADGLGYGGEQTNKLVLRWERQADNILLRVVSYTNTADEEKPIAQAVRNSNFEPILKSFAIAAYNADTSAVVIDVSDLYLDDVPALGLPTFRRTGFQVRRLDRSRSYLERVASYPLNVEVRHVLTYEAGQPPSNASTGAITLEMAQSMILLPEEPMQPRLCDERVGFFSTGTVDYGRDAQKAETRCFITRFRLEPKDPEAYARGELVEPVKPIVYYVDPATPEKWRPYLKQGVDDWQAAFEKAGFKNAIMGKYPPTPEEDPEFNPEDVRYSVMRYFASDIENAYGPNVNDPRSGEILESDIGWYHNVMNLLRNWYLVQTAAANPDARTVKFSDELMGELIRFVAAHEVGHTIGLQHNMISSATVPVDSLRSPTYTALHGTAPSIMDYARFNYVAQPGDGVTRFFPMIGPYDEWAIQWGYTRRFDHLGPDGEKVELNKWTVEKTANPQYRFGSGFLSDPNYNTEALGDDAMKANDLGIENLKRILPNLPEWTAEEAKNYEDLKELVGEVTGQYNRYIGHVVRYVGGAYQTLKTTDQPGPVYESVEKARQQQAIDWLDRQVFTTPTWMIHADILRRFEDYGITDVVRRSQESAIRQLFDGRRLGRMFEYEALVGDATYTVEELLVDLRTRIWRELSAAAPAVDPYRRNLQRAHLEQLAALMQAPAIASNAFLGSGVNLPQTDVQALVRGELAALKASATRAGSRSRDRLTQLHLADVVARIDAALDPEN